MQLISSSTINHNQLERYDRNLLAAGMAQYSGLGILAFSSYYKHRALASFNQEMCYKQKLFVNLDLGYPSVYINPNIFTDKEISFQSSPSLAIGLRYFINRRNYAYAKYVGFQDVSVEHNFANGDIQAHGYNIGIGWCAFKNSNFNVYVETGIGRSDVQRSLTVPDLKWVDQSHSKELNGLLGVGVCSAVDKPWYFDLSANYTHLMPMFRFSVNKRLY